MKHKKDSIRFIESCYRLYEQKMYGYAYRILKDAGLAEDAVQNSFLRLMKRETFFQDPESEECKRYIITVVRNAAIDLFNERRKSQEMICLSNDDELFEQAVLDESEQGAEEHEWLLDHMKQLSEDYRRVVLCIAGRNMSVRETAKHLGISEVNVRKRYERAKKKLVRMREEQKDVYIPTQKKPKVLTLVQIVPEHQKKTGKGEDEYEGNQYGFIRYNG